jgi:hypothetical protein
LFTLIFSSCGSSSNRIRKSAYVIVIVRNVSNEFSHQPFINEFSFDSFINEFSYESFIDDDSPFFPDVVDACCGGGFENNSDRFWSGFDFAFDLSVNDNVNVNVNVC